MHRVIRENYQPVVHAHNICQSARIISMVRAPPPASPTNTTVTGSVSSEGEDEEMGRLEVEEDPSFARSPEESRRSAGIKSGERAVCR